MYDVRIFSAPQKEITKREREREQRTACKVKVIMSRLGTRSLGREELEEREEREVTILRLRVIIITFRHRQHL